MECPGATIGAMTATSTLAIRLPQDSRADDEASVMTKPITPTNRLVYAVVTAATGFSVVVHAQFMILPPHFV